MYNFFEPVAWSLPLTMLGVYLYADVEAGSDEFTIRREQTISHLWGARERGVAIGFLAATAHVMQLGLVFRSPAVLLALLVWLLQIGMLAVTLMAEFWIAFDLRLNLRRGKAWDYTGTKATADKLGTRLFAGNTKRMILIKAVLMLVLLAGYISATVLFQRVLTG